MDKLPDILFIACNDFDTLWYQRQALAVKFAEAGHRVFYVNKTPQRWPRPVQALKWLAKRTSKKQREKQPPENLKVVSPFWLVPAKMLKPINRKLVRRTLKTLDIRNPVVITDVPSYNTLEAIEQLRPEKVVYINVHNYDCSDRITKAIKDSEKALVRQADILFADSQLNAERLKRISGGREVFRSLPGVDFELFERAFRGSEAKEAKTIYFFGMVHDMVNIELYNRLSEKFKVVFIGEVVDNVKNLISKKIEIKKPLEQKALAARLAEADILSLFYKNNAYTKGVIPAKIFECIATGKPILVSGIEEDSVYSKHVYHFDGTEQKAVEIIENLKQTETQEKIKRRFIAGAFADWQKRFEKFCDVVFAQNEVLPKFSVLMSVYKKDRPEYFAAAMDSVINQTARPDEIVLVKDGPVSNEIDCLINEYKRKIGYVLKVVELKENKGLGAALAEGVKRCAFDIIARMDADDLSAPNRFEKQLKFLVSNPGIDVVSCFIATFDETPDKPLFIRRCPLLSEEIEKNFRFRFCTNHAPSMFRKKTVLAAGNYDSFASLEDYHLWARMLLNGGKIANIGQVLYYHRWENELLKRRSGLKRAAQQIKLQREFLKMGFINAPQFLRNVIIRSAAAILPQTIIRKIRIIFGI